MSGAWKSLRRFPVCELNWRLLRLPESTPSFEKSVQPSADTTFFAYAPWFPLYWTSRRGGRLVAVSPVVWSGAGELGNSGSGDTSPPDMIVADETDDSAKSSFLPFLI